MTCRIADFGLSVDLAASEAPTKAKEDDGIYGAADVVAPDAASSGEPENLRIPIRWTAIEVSIVSCTACCNPAASWVISGPVVQCHVMHGV